MSAARRHVIQPERQAARADQRNAQDAGRGDGAGPDPHGQGGRPEAEHQSPLGAWDESRGTVEAYLPERERIDEERGARRRKKQEAVSSLDLPDVPGRTNGGARIESFPAAAGRQGGEIDFYCGGTELAVDRQRLGRRSSLADAVEPEVNRGREGLESVEHATPVEELLDPRALGRFALEWIDGDDGVAIE